MLKNKTRCVVLVLLTIYCGGLTLTARWVLSSESQQQQQLYRSPSLENEQVEHVRQGLLAIKSGFSGRTWGRMRQFIEKEGWRAYPSLVRPALISSIMLGTGSLGNCLGYYYQTRAFCEAVGLDYLSAPLLPKYKETFLAALPLIQVHMTGNFSKKMAFRFFDECPAYVHQCRRSRFLHYLPTVRKELSEALLPFKRHDFEVAVHFRCGDVLKADAPGYGLLRYQALKELLGSESPKRITVLTQPVGPECRTNDCPFLETCRTIYSDLARWLSKTYPKSKTLVVSIRDVSETMAALTFARKLICSSSSMCLFAAITNENESFLPISELFFNGSSLDLGPNIKWFENGLVPSRNLANMNVEEILRALRV